MSKNIEEISQNTIEEKRAKKKTPMTMRRGNHQMQITDVTAVKNEVKGHPIKGYCKIIFDNCFVVETRVIQNRNGFYVAFPGYMNKKGKYMETAYPTDKKLRDKIIEASIKAYQEL